MFRSMDGLIAFDRFVFNWFNSTLSHPWLDAVVPVITDLHKSAYGRWSIPLILLFLFFQHHRGKGFLIFLSLIVTLGLSDFTAGQFLKKSVERARPFEVVELKTAQRCPAAGYSFPSNHAVNMFAVALFASVFLPQWTVFFIGMAFLIGYTRVYCGVHYPSDVVAGALYGALLGFASARATRMLLCKFSKPAEPTVRSASETAP